MLLQTIGSFLKKNETTILTGGGLLLIGIGTLYLYKKSPKLHEQVKTLKEENAPASKIILETCKEALPGVSAWTAGLALVLCSDAKSTDKLKKTTAALEATTAVHNVYREVEAKKLSEIEGGTKILSDIRNEVAEKLGANETKTAPNKITKIFKTSPEIYQTGNGDQLIVDRYSQRKFRSSIAAVNASVQRLREEAHGTYVNYNDLNNELNLPAGGAYEEVGWNSSHLPAIMWDSYVDNCEVIAEFYFPKGSEPIKNYKD